MGIDGNSNPVQQRMVDQPMVGTDHFLQRGAEILQIPLQQQGDLDADKARKDELIGFQLGGIQEGQDALVFLPQKFDTLIHQ